MEFQAPNPNYRDTIAKILSSQAFIQALGISLGDLGPGFCELRLKLRPDHLQHGGVAHGGVIGTLADNAAGAAAGTLMPVGFATVTAEYRISFLAAAKGEQLIARGEVLKAGKALFHTKSDVFAISGEKRIHCATLLATMVPFDMGTRS